MSSKSKDIPLSEIKEIASKAISCYNFDLYLEDFNENEIRSLCRNANVDMFSDRVLVDNDIIRTNFPWERISSRRLCRMMARLLDLNHDSILDDIKTKDMKVRVRDLKAILIRRPEIIERFNIDMQRLSDTDAHAALSLGKDYFLDRINIKGRGFNSNQQYDICKAYGYQRRVLLLFDCTRFDGFHTSEILKRTKEESVDLLELRTMKLTDWINLLEEAPEFYNRLDVMKFKGESIMHLINLAHMFDDDLVYGIILGRDLKEVSPFGWEKLLSNRPDMFESLCDYGKLDAMNRRIIISKQPHLAERFNAIGPSPAASHEEP